MLKSKFLRHAIMICVGFGLGIQIELSRQYMTTSNDDVAAVAAGSAPGRLSQQQLDEFRGRKLTRTTPSVFSNLPTQQQRQRQRQQLLLQRNEQDESSSSSSSSSPLKESMSKSNSAFEEQIENQQQSLSSPATTATASSEGDAFMTKSRSPRDLLASMKLKQHLGTTTTTTTTTTTQQKTGEKKKQKEKNKDTIKKVLLRRPASNARTTDTKKSHHKKAKPHQKFIPSANKITKRGVIGSDTIQAIHTGRTNSVPHENKEQVRSLQLLNNPPGPAKISNASAPETASQRRSRLKLEEMRARVQEQASRPMNFTLEKPWTYNSTNLNMSACLLIMDDRIRLTEWLAYHYTVLPLGHLMVAIDPESHNPEAVVETLELWKDRIEMKIYTNDSEWMELKWDQGWLRKIYRPDGTMAEWFQRKSGPIWRSQHHKRRQNEFVVHCMRHMKKWGHKRDDMRYEEYVKGMRKQKEKGGSNKTPKFQTSKNFVLLTDSDEFLLYNYVHLEEEQSSSQYLLVEREEQADLDAARRRLQKFRRRLPPLSQRVTIADYMAQERIPKPNTCFKMPGLQMSSYDYNADDGAADKLPNGINPDHFMTLRYSLAAPRRGNFSKTMIDVGFGGMDTYSRGNMFNIHTPNTRVCGRNGYTGSRADYMSSLFRINHYSSGTLETFVERAADRRAASLSLDRYLSRNVEPELRDTDIQPWIGWFVDKVGEEEARRLLIEPMKQAYDEMDHHPFLENLRARGHPGHLKYEGPKLS